MIRLLPLIGGLLCLLACSKNNRLAPNNTDTLGYTVPANPPADINFTLGGVSYFLVLKVDYYNYDGSIQVCASDWSGGTLTIFIPYDYGDTVYTTSGSFLYTGGSGINYFSYSCENRLSAAAIFHGDTLYGSFYGTIQYDDTYAYYPTVQGTFFNVPMAQ